MNTTLIGIILFSLFCISVTIYKGLIPFVKMKLDMDIQKKEFRKFLEIIRRLTGQYSHRDNLEKNSVKGDTMNRVLERHVFMYHGGIHEYDQMLKSTGKELPVKTVLYSEGEILCLIDRDFISSDIEISEKNLKKNTFSLPLSSVKRFVNNSHSEVEIVCDYFSFVMSSYVWKEIFIDEIISRDENDINQFFINLFTAESTKKPEEDIDNISLAGFNSILDILVKKMIDSSRRKKTDAPQTHIHCKNV